MTILNITRTIEYLIPSPIFHDIVVSLFSILLFLSQFKYILMIIIVCYKSICRINLFCLVLLFTSLHILNSSILHPCVYPQIALLAGVPKQYLSRTLLVWPVLTSLLNQHLAMSRTRLRFMFAQCFEDILLSSGFWCGRQEGCCQPNCSSFPDNLTFLTGCFRNCPCPFPVSPYVPSCGFIFISTSCSLRVLSSKTDHYKNFFSQYLEFDAWVN